MDTCVLDMEKKLELKRAIGAYLDALGFSRGEQEYRFFVDVCFYLYKEPKLSIQKALELVALDHDMAPKPLYYRVNHVFKQYVYPKAQEPFSRVLHTVCNNLCMDFGTYNEFVGKESGE